jgi:hypothetical protein
MPLPQRSVSEQLASAFATMPSALPVDVAKMCDAVLMDVAGLCVAARNSDYLQAALHAPAEPGVCALVGRRRSTWRAALRGTAAHGEDYDDTFEAAVHAGAVIIRPCWRPQNSINSPGAPRRGIAVGCGSCRLCHGASSSTRQDSAGFVDAARWARRRACRGDATRRHAVGDALDRRQHGVRHHRISRRGAWTKQCIRAGRRRQATTLRAWRKRVSGWTLFDGEHGSSCVRQLRSLRLRRDARRRGQEVALRRHCFQARLRHMAHPLRAPSVAEGVRPADVASIECKPGIVHRL